VLLLDLKLLLSYLIRCLEFLDPYQKQTRHRTLEHKSFIIRTF
jgi:hypothetical protein